MAIENVTQADIGRSNDEGGYPPASQPHDSSANAALPSPVRYEVARLACSEIVWLSRMLHSYIERNDETLELAPTIRASLLRLETLSDAIFDAVVTEDPQESDATLVQKLGGWDVMIENVEGGAA